MTLKYGVPPHQTSRIGTSSSLHNRQDIARRVPFALIALGRGVGLLEALRWLACGGPGPRLRLRLLRRERPEDEAALASGSAAAATGAEGGAGGTTTAAAGLTLVPWFCQNSFEEDIVLKLIDVLANTGACCA